MILLIDNYDSFSWNLAHLFGALGAEVVVRRNDELDADEAERLAPSHLVVSPGPGRPAAAGSTSAIVERLLHTTPTLGVCLGHQALVEACGGEVGYARELVHGKASPVRHDGSGLFAGLPDPFEAGRYHSLAATRLPDVLEPTAYAEDGEVMAVRHRHLPAVGVQFHPESVLTPDGPALARNFLEGKL
jgi:anthranilate synthase/aminodeoxychorismate synthase-like glutamine amidotransferase